MWRGQPFLSPSDFYSDRKRRVLIEERVTGRMDHSRFPAIVHEIQSALDTVGHMSVLGGILTWSPAAQGPSACRTVVTLTPAGDYIDIRIEERIEVEGPRVLAAPIGGMIGGALGLVLSVSNDPLMMVLAVGGAIVGRSAACAGHSVRARLAGSRDCWF
jgi:hypothetical protein